MAAIERGGPLPRDIVTRAALENACAVVAATGGSTNGALHIPAIAHEAGITFDIDDVGRVFERTPLIADLRPGAERAAFLDTLAHLGRINEHQLAEEARLYLTRKQLCELASLDFEIGNHTYSHVRCRSLTAENLAGEIDRNKAELEAVSGKKVRSFSVPYGSSEDLSIDLEGHLRLSGHGSFSE